MYENDLVSHLVRKAYHVFRLGLYTQLFIPVCNLHVPPYLSSSFFPGVAWTRTCQHRDDMTWHANNSEDSKNYSWSRHVAPDAWIQHVCVKFIWQSSMVNVYMLPSCFLFFSFLICDLISPLFPSYTSTYHCVCKCHEPVLILGHPVTIPHIVMIKPGLSATVFLAYKCLFI